MHIYSTLPSDYSVDLQLFAEEGEASDTTAEATAETGEETTPDTRVADEIARLEKKLGIKSSAIAKTEEEKPTQEVAAPQEEKPAEKDKNALFEELIKGEYKEAYDQRVANTVKARVKGMSEKVARYESLAPMLDRIAAKYGLTDASDLNALAKAIDDDDSLLEDQALARGMTVEQYRDYSRMENENKALRARDEEATARSNADKQYREWMSQAEEAKKVYPDLDLRAEAGNERFASLLKSGIDVRTAYEVVHKDEILSSAIAYAAKTAESKLASKIASNQARPQENGAGGSAFSTKTDVSQLSRAEREALIERARHGEKISFG